MNREVHVRFWESPEVKVLRATRQRDSRAAKEKRGDLHQPRTLALPQAGGWYHRVYRADGLVRPL
jgi:hypothetical protein